MIHEPDGVAEEVEALLQRGGQAAADVARSRAQRRAHELLEAAKESERRAGDAQARFETERHAARAQLAGVERPEWWERASATTIVAAWEAAQGWREHDELANRAAVHMRSQMIERLGVDPLEVGAEPVGDADPTDTGYYGAHDVTPEEALTWAAEVERPRPIGERGRELQAALAELHESRRLSGASRQATVAETIARGGPQRAPRARRGRGRPGVGAERERGR
jgi:colicin import membrane protein